MGGTNDKLIHLHERAPQRALEGLNRVTGLRFRQWPESLAPKQPEEATETEPATPETGRAMPG